MIKSILFSFLTLVSLNSFGQINNTWLNYLKSIANQFYRTDTIIFSYKNLDENELPKYLKKVNANDCNFLFNSQIGFGCENNFFLTLKLFKDNYSVITLFSYGKYTPIITLYNYSATGELIKYIEVESSQFDAGLADSTSTRFKNDSTFSVNQWKGYEEERKGISLLYDSVIISDYIIKPNGLILKQ